jgi:hypothetical protein
MGVPNHIEGCWANHVEERSKFYKISVPIDSDLAEKKIRTMQNYYKNYSTIWPVMQVIVDSVYSLACFNRTDDCTPKKNADPNHWVQRAPNGLTDVVVLFDGKGEYVDCNSKLN